MHVFNGGVSDYDILLGAAALGSDTGPTSAQLLPLEQLVVKTRQDAAVPTGHLQGQLRTRPGRCCWGIRSSPAPSSISGSTPRTSASRCPGSAGAATARPTSTSTARASTDPSRSPGCDRSRTVRSRTRSSSTASAAPSTSCRPTPASRGMRTSASAARSTAPRPQEARFHPNTDRTFKATKAPAPASCYVPACSPSGAFLDDE